MRIEYGSGGKPILHITEEEREEVNLLKREIEYFLDDFGLFERDNLSLEVSQYIFDSLITKKLLSMRKKEILDQDFDEAFYELFEIEGRLERINDINIFIVFVGRYNMLENKEAGYKVIKKIARIKVIDWLLKNDFQQNEIDDDGISSQIKIDKFDIHIFDSRESQEFIIALIKYLLEDPNSSLNRTVSFVFRQFWIHERFPYFAYSGKEYKIISTIRNFEKYINKNINSSFKIGDIDQLEAIGEMTKVGLNNRVMLFKQACEEYKDNKPR